MTRYINAQWPNIYPLLGATVAVALLWMAIGAWQGWWALLPLMAALILFTSYAYAAATWLVQRMYAHATIADALWRLSGLGANGRFMFIDVGLRSTPIELSKRLANGQITIVDIYKPQMMPDPALARTRQLANERTAMPLSDPRTEWLEGRIDLLPAREESVQIVMLNQVLSTIDQQRDQDVLLREIEKVLVLGGRLLVVERVQRGENKWLVGSGGWDSAENWRTLLTKNRFELKDEVRVNGLLTAFRVDKPFAPPQQLRFDF